MGIVSCRMPTDWRFIDMTGRRYGRLWATYIEQARNRGGQRVWKGGR